MASRHRLVISIFIILSCFVHASPIIETKSRVYFSENPIIFDPPIIKKDHQYFAPIRSFVTYFDGQMNRSKKTYSYQVTINDYTLLFKPNSKKYKVNNVSHVAKSPPFIYKTRLYVPLITTLNHLGIQTVKKSHHFYSHQNKEASQITDTVLLSYNQSFNASITRMIMPIAKRSIPLKKQTVNGVLKVDAHSFLEFLGYQIIPSKYYVRLKKNGIIYQFNHDSNQVSIINGNSKRNTPIDYKPSIINERLFVELSPFLNDLGFDYLLDGNNLVVLKKMNSMSFFPDSSIILNKNSRIPLGQGHKLSNPHRFYWDLPFTRCPSKPILPTKHAVSSVQFGQKNTTCRMVFHFDSHYHVDVSSSSPNQTTFKLTTYTPVTKSKKPPPAPVKNMDLAIKGKVIIIDPGHGGYDPGAVNKNNDYEKYYTLDISKRIQQHLKKRGAVPILLRKNDTNPSLYQRVKKTNQLNGDFLVSVHVNSFINGLANGTETYYYKKSEKKAAQYIQHHMIKQLKRKNNGIKHAKMYILKHSKIPGVLIEPCFMTNSNEYQLLKTYSFRNKIALAVVDGLEDYFKNK